MTTTGKLLEICAGVLVLSAASPLSARAQFWDRLTNGAVTVNLTHSPQVVLKPGTKVAVLDFRDNSGACGSELSIRLANAIRGNPTIELVDRDNIQAILQEQGFQNSGAVDQTAAVKISQLVGPAAAFTGHVTRCSTEQSEILRGATTKDKNGLLHQWFVRRATSEMTGTVQFIDLTSGRVLASKFLSVGDTLVNQAEDAYPEAPSADAVQTKMYEDAIGQLQPVLLPWTEAVRLIVYDDNKCQLKQSSGQIKSGELDAAATTLRSALATSCGRPDDKNVLSKAHYNLGLALAYSDHEQEGLAELDSAEALRSTSIARDAIASIQKKIALESRARAQEAAATTLLAADRTTASQQGAPAKGLFSNTDVLSLLKARVSDRIIIAKIKTSPCHFDTSTDALIALNKAGASDAVVLAMTDAAANRCK